MKPILFMDVDGVLNPFSANPNKFERLGMVRKFFRAENSNGKMRVLDWVSKNVYDTSINSRFDNSSISVFPFIVKPSVTPLLKDLSDRFQFVWGTTWENEANIHVSPLYDLPDFPYVEFSSYDSGDNLHWKTKQLFDWSDGTPFIWFDDDVSRVDNLFLQGSGCLGVRVDPHLGFMEGHYNNALKWLAGL